MGFDGKTIELGGFSSQPRLITWGKARILPCGRKLEGIEQENKAQAQKIIGLGGGNNTILSCDMLWLNKKWWSNRI